MPVKYCDFCGYPDTRANRVALELLKHGIEWLRWFEQRMVFDTEHGKTFTAIGSSVLAGQTPRMSRKDLIKVYLSIQELRSRQEPSLRHFAERVLATLRDFAELMDEEEKR